MAMLVIPESDPSAESLLHQTMRSCEQSPAFADWNFRNERVTEAMALVIAAVAAWKPWVGSL